MGALIAVCSWRVKSREMRSDYTTREVDYVSALCIYSSKELQPGHYNARRDVATKDRGPECGGTVGVWVTE